MWHGSGFSGKQKEKSKFNNIRKHMKKYYLLSVVAGIAFASFQCSALLVDVTRVTDPLGNPYFTYPGGEFNVALAAQDTTPSDATFFNNDILANYSSAAIVDGPNGIGFETFCNSGSTGLQNNPQQASFTTEFVSLGGAWLYSQFAQGILSGYDYNPDASGGIFTSRAQAAYALQNAIWGLDGTGGEDLNTGATGYSYYIDLAYSMFGNSDTNAADGAYGVQELLLSYNDAPAQPMLVIVTPDGGSTVILLGMALTGIAVLTRRLVRA
jgi:hypothetical protein